MKKIVLLLILITLFTSPAHADSMFGVTVTVNEPSIVQIAGDSPLPEVCEIEVQDSYTFNIDFQDVGEYMYEIKQISTKDDVILDDTVYILDVYVSRGTDGLICTATVNKSGDLEKEPEVIFENVKKENPEDPKDPEDPKPPEDPEKPKTPEDPEDPESPKSPEEPPSPPKDSTITQKVIQLVKTGDSTKIVPYAILLISALVGTLFVIKKGIKNEK